MEVRFVRSVIGGTFAISGNITVEIDEKLKKARFWSIIADFSIRH